jgi:putative membrane protein
MPKQQVKTRIPAEDDLVARARNRDEAAVRAIIRQNNQRLFRVARSIMKDDGEAEDVVQESYVRAFTRLNEFRGESSLNTWLTRVVINETYGRSKALTKQAADKRAELAKLNGAAFDKAYIDNEVAYHKTVNSALEKTLIPSASNPELKDLLTAGLKIFQGHEQHAEHVAAELK